MSRAQQHREELEKYREKKRQAHLTNTTTKAPIIKPHPITINDFKELNALVPSQRNTKIQWLTCKGRSDGIGAQCMGIISVMVTAKSLGLEYTYYPFTYIDHCPLSSGNNPTERELKQWVNRFELMFNFNQISSVSYLHNLTGIVKTLDCREIIGAFKSGNLKGAHVVATRETHDFNDLFRNDPNMISAWKTVISDILKSYGWERNYLPHFTQVGPGDGGDGNGDGKYINVGVHIRMGDAIGNEKRTIDSEYYINILTLIINGIKDLNTLRHTQYKIIFHIYSQGDTSQFTNLHFLEEAGLSYIIYHLNVDVCETIHHLANSNILVMAKSTLSYVCALLNPKGFIIYHPFWIQPPKHLESDWIHTDLIKDIYRHFG